MSKRFVSTGKASLSLPPLPAREHMIKLSVRPLNACFDFQPRHMYREQGESIKSLITFFNEWTKHYLISGNSSLSRRGSSERKNIGAHINSKPFSAAHSASVQWIFVPLEQNLKCCARLFFWWRLKIGGSFPSFRISTRKQKASVSTQQIWIYMMVTKHSWIDVCVLQLFLVVCW